MANYLTNTAEADMDISDREGIKKAFLSAILDEEKTRLQKLMGEIQDQHSLRHGSRGFLLDGRVIVNGDTAAVKVRNKKHIDKDLEPEARIIETKRAKLSADEQRLCNFMGTLVPRCHSFQDYRDVLPNLVVDRMDHPQIMALPRTREQGYVFASEPIKMKLFHDASGIMFHYLVNRLVY